MRFFYFRGRSTETHLKASSLPLSPGLVLLFLFLLSFLFFGWICVDVRRRCVCAQKENGQREEEGEEELS